MSHAASSNGTATGAPLVHAAALRFRRGSLADLDRCAQLLPSGFRASPGVMRNLIPLWRRLLASEAHSFTIVEDLERPHPANIEGFGLSVFVTHRFVEEFCASPRPYLAACFYERVLAGDHVVLTDQQLRNANTASDLNVVVLHFGLVNEDLADRRTEQVLAAGSSAFYFFHSGYRIHTLVNEVYGPQQRRYMERGGFRLMHDFRRERPADFEGMAPEKDPYLFMLRRDWMDPGVIHPLSRLFSPPLPRFGFAPSERRLLEGALLNESDQQIANRIGRSPDTIKKLWRSIYDRASREIPSLIPEPDEAPSGSRGQEKRRHLLEYLRIHMEELRPAPTPSPIGNQNT